MADAARKRPDEEDDDPGSGEPVVLTCGECGALGGTRTPNLLIRRSVRACPASAPESVSAGPGSRPAPGSSRRDAVSPAPSPPVRETRCGQLRGWPAAPMPAHGARLAAWGHHVGAMTDSPLPAGMPLPVPVTPTLPTPARHPTSQASLMTTFNQLATRVYTWSPGWRRRRGGYVRSALAPRWILGAVQPGRA